MTYNNKTLENIIQTAHKLSTNIKDTFKGQSVTDPDYLEEKVEEAYSHIHELIQAAEKAGTVQEHFMVKSGVWIENLQIRLLNDPQKHGYFEAAIRSKEETASRKKSGQSSNITEDFLGAVKHVRRYTRHALNNGEAKTYGEAKKAPVLESM